MTRSMKGMQHINGLVHDCGIFNASVMDTPQSYIKPSIYISSEYFEDAKHLLISQNIKIIYNSPPQTNIKLTVRII